MSIGCKRLEAIISLSQELCPNVMFFIKERVDGSDNVIDVITKYFAALDTRRDYRLRECTGEISML